MRLVQLNIWGGRLMTAVVKLMQSLGPPDLLCAQEVISTRVPTVFGTFEELQGYLGYPHTHFSPTFHFTMMDDDAEFGNAVLSRLPIKESATEFMHLDYVRNFSFARHSYNIRNMQHAVVEAGDRLLNVVNYHGYHIEEHKNGDDTSRRLCERLAAYVTALDGPVILTGDFNLAPTSASLEPLDAVLRNLSTEYGLESTRTPLTNKVEVCDYVFVSEDVRVDSFAASDALVSDHAALVLDFHL